MLDNQSSEQGALGALPLFVPVRAPELTSRKKNDILQFIRSWEMYEKKVGETSGVSVASIQNCMDASTFAILFEGVLDSDSDHENAVVLKALKERAGGSERKYRQDLEAMFSSISVDMSIADPEDRVTEYHYSIMKMISDNQIADLFNAADKKRQRNSWMLKQVHPSIVQEMMRSQMDRNNHCSRTDLKAFMELLKETTLSQHLTFVAGKNLAKSRKRSRPDAKEPGLLVEVKRLKAEIKSLKTQDSNWKRRGSKTEAPTGGCLKCSGEHWLRECPHATRDERKRLYREYRERREQSQKHTARNKGLRFNYNDQISCFKTTLETNKVSDTMDIDQNNQNKIVQSLFADKVPVNVELDSGSDVTLISQEVLNKVKSCGGSCRLRRLREPIPLSQVFDGTTDLGNQHTCRTIASMAVTLIVRTGRVRLTNVPCYVVDAALNGALIGREELSRLGINPKENLEQKLSEKTLQVKLLKQESLLSNPQVDDEASCPESHGMETEGPEVDLQIDEQEIDAALADLIKRTRDAGASEQFVSGAQDLVQKYRDVWRTKLVADPPARVEPMKVFPKPDARPVKARAIRSSPLHNKFLEEHIQKLLKLGYIYRNQHSRYASPAMAVKKPKSDGYRMVVNTKKVNAMLESIVWPMPFFEVILQHLAGATCFASLDAFKGYWQFPMDEKAQEMYSFICHLGVFTPRRVIQGASNSVQIFQAGMEEILGDLLYQQVLVWIDDLLAYGATDENLLSALDSIFKRLHARGVKLNPKKCTLYQKSVNWCGRIIAADGIKFDTKLTESLVQMPIPKTAADLQQYLCAANWIRSAIPEFSKTFGPLQKILKKSIETAASSKKSKLAAIALQSVGWCPDHEVAFSASKKSISASVKLSIPRADAEVCVFTDASKDCWSIMLTQIPADQVSRAPKEQNHEPLAFLSGEFKGAQTRWAIVDKEFYPIVVAVTRLRHFLVRRQGFRIFTDHRNLVYILDPSGRNVSKNVDDRLERWAMKLSGLFYIIEHISGEDNVWADMLTRWASKPAVKSLRVKVPKALVTPLLNESFVWPTLEEVANIQASHCKEKHLLSLSRGKHDLLATASAAVWIPFGESGQLRLRVMIIAHCASAGHRGIQATTKTISQRFYWDGMREDVKNFCLNCLHCLRYKATIVPRPFGEVLHAKKAGEVLHFDFLKIGLSKKTWKYLLVIKDDLSNFVRLYGCEEATSFVTADAILDWVSMFTMPKFFVSDQGSHFKNQTIKELARLLQVDHHFVTAYCPWANGTVERVNKDILVVLKSLLSEFRLAPTEWPRLVNLIQMVLNNTPSNALGGLTPIQVFTGQQPSSPLDAIMAFSFKDHFQDEALAVDFVIKTFQDLVASLRSMHKKVQDCKDKQRRASRKRRSSRRATKPINFEVGDYVLVAKVKSKIRGKLDVVWSGPRRIRKVVHDHVYEVEDLVDKSVALSHAERMRYYADDSLDVSESLMEQLVHDDTGYVVDTIEDVRRNGDSYDVLVHWLGFDVAEESWEDLFAMIAQVPKVIKKFLTSSKSAAPLRKEIVAALKRRGFCSKELKNL